MMQLKHNLVTEIGFEHTEKEGSRILEAAGRLEREVVFGPSWPLEVSIGTKIYFKL